MVTTVFNALLIRLSEFFKKMADEKVSAFRETTLNHGFYGHNKVENDEKGERGGKGLYNVLVFILATLEIYER